MNAELTIQRFSCEPSQIHRLYEWIVQSVRINIQPRTLDAFAGNGELASILVGQEIYLHLNESNADWRLELRERFEVQSIVRKIHGVDMDAAEWPEAIPRMDSKFNTVLGFCFRDDWPNEQHRLQNIHCLLKEDGLFLGALPSRVALFPGIEPDPGYLVRMEQGSLRHRLSPFSLLALSYFELIAAPDPSPHLRSGLYVLVIARKSNQETSSVDLF